MSGRKGSSGHQNLIRYSSMKLLNEIIGDEWLNVVLIREQSLDVKTRTDITGTMFGSSRVAQAEVRMYADIACAVVFDPKAKAYFGAKPIFEHMLPAIEKFREEGNMDEYFKAVRTAYGQMIYIIECEINPRSGLLRDGSKLTAYKLIKQQNNNLRLILSVFEGTKVDNPGIFDDVWYFPKKGRKRK